MNTERYLVAITCSDIHASLKPPPFRSLEEDWIGVQRNYLRQIKRITSVGNGKFWFPGEKVPLIIAGDLSNKWTMPPEVISMLIEELPDNTYAVPGNHDLPSHRYESMNKSVYGVLVASGKVKNIDPNEPVEIDGSTPIRLHGFPCGYCVHELTKPSNFFLEIAVVHDYIWASTSTGYSGAPEEKLLKVWREKLRGYDIALFGDNHKGFLAEAKDQCTVLNCGTFMIRKSDERGYKPAVGLIYSDGSVERRFLDTSKDKYLEDSEIVKALEMVEDGGFIEELMSLYDKAMDVEECFRRAVEDVKNDVVKSLILRSIGVGGE